MKVRYIIMAKTMNPTKVITGKDTRWSYCNIWDAKSINGGTPKFSISLIIPKSDETTIRKIKAAIEAAYHDGESKLRGNGKTVPPLVAIKNPLRDGDTERPDDPAYKNAYFVNANSATAPGVVDADCNPILTRSEVYSGVYGLPAAECLSARFPALPVPLYLSSCLFRWLWLWLPTVHFLPKGRLL